MFYGLGVSIRFGIAQQSGRSLNHGLGEFKHVGQLEGKKSG